MKVFLSWSGADAKTLARLLSAWLPNVIQSLEPWTSEEIGKGTRWSDEIARELDESRFGILCVDRRHLESPWIHFEAGAIAKSVQGATARNRVTPLLLGIDESDLRDPLGLFQATKLERDDMWRLVRSLNEVQDVPLDVPRLEMAFEHWWPGLESEIAELKAGIDDAPEPAGVEAIRPSDEILDEVLHLLRDQRRAVARLEQGIVRSAPFDDLVTPLNRVSEDRRDEARAALGTLGLRYSEIVWHSDDVMTVKLEDLPHGEALHDLGAWARRNRWDVTLKARGKTFRVGISRRLD